MKLNTIDFVILFSILFVVLMMFILFLREKNFVRRENIRANNARASSRHLRWLADHPHWDNSHPEAQLLLKKRINAYGLFCKEFHPIDGEERIKELTRQLELTPI